MGRGKGRLELVFCCSTKDMAEGLNLEGRRDWRLSSVNLCFLVLFRWCVLSEWLLVLGTGMRRVVRKDICAPFGVGSESKGRLQWVFCYRARDESGVWISGTPGQMWVHLHPIWEK